MDLQLLREVLADNKVHIAMGKITKIEMPADRSALFVTCEVWPEKNTVAARMTWQAIGPDAGTFTLPSVDDLVLLALAYGDHDYHFVIGRLTSKADKIPLQADTGTVIKERAGKKVYVISDTKIDLQRGSTEATEPFVLGNIFKSMMSAILQEIITHTHTGNAGFPTSPPLNAANFVAKKATPVDDGAVLSDLIMGVK